MLVLGQVLCSDWLSCPSSGLIFYLRGFLLGGNRGQLTCQEVICWYPLLATPRPSDCGSCAAGGTSVAATMVSTLSWIHAASSACAVLRQHMHHKGREAKRNPQ